MSVWAIADLHLSISVPEKHMKIFGSPWFHYEEKIKSNWTDLISPEDLVLLPGDISWAMHLNDALIDLEWIHQLPGTKVMIKGNHDYWWNSYNRLRSMLPPSIHAIQNNSFVWKDFCIGGARLWDSPEYGFSSVINYKPMPESVQESKEIPPPDIEKIFSRELGRLEASLSSMKSSNRIKIAMTHYPPIDVSLHETEASKLLEKYAIECCVFGHLHNVKKEMPLFGEKNGIRYCLTSADYLDFIPLRIY